MALCNSRALFFAPALANEKNKKFPSQKQVGSIFAKFRANRELMMQILQVRDKNPFRFE